MIETRLQDVMTKKVVSLLSLGGVPDNALITGTGARGPSACETLSSTEPVGESSSESGRHRSAEVTASGGGYQDVQVGKARCDLLGVLDLSDIRLLRASC